MNEDLDEKDEIIEELELNRKKGWANKVSKLESQETDVPGKDIINALENKSEDLTRPNKEIFGELLKRSRELKILQIAEKISPLSNTKRAGYVAIMDFFTPCVPSGCMRGVTSFLMVVLVCRK